MSATIRDFLKIAGVVIVTLGLLGLIFYGYNKSSGFANKAFGKIDNMSNMLEESDYTKYDGAIISGSDVVAAIKYFSVDENICIQVNNGRTTTNYVCEDTSLTAPATAKISDAQNRNKLEKYINPNGKFIGELVRDAGSNLVVAIKFTPVTSTTP